MNKQTVLNMNVASEKQTHLLEKKLWQSLPSSTFPTAGGGYEKLGSLQPVVWSLELYQFWQYSRKVFYTPNLQKSIHDFHVDKGQMSL